MIDSEIDNQDFDTSRLERFAQALCGSVDGLDWRGFRNEFESLTKDERRLLIAGLGQAEILKHLRLSIVGMKDGLADAGKPEEEGPKQGEFSNKVTADGEWSVFLNGKWRPVVETYWLDTLANFDVVVGRG